MSHEAQLCAVINGMYFHAFNEAPNDNDCGVCVSSAGVCDVEPDIRQHCTTVQMLFKLSCDETLETLDAWLRCSTWPKCLRCSTCVAINTTWLVA